MSLQIAILKVLAGFPGGRAAIADLNRTIATLGASGPDWTNRLKRLAARAPDLDIFGEGLVAREAGGWRLTEAGRERLESLETPAPPMPGPKLRLVACEASPTFRRKRKVQHLARTARGRTRRGPAGVIHIN